MDWSNVEKSSVNSIRENVISVVDTLGRAALHAMAPDNFEYYMCSLELLDSSKSTKGFMTFAVMPNNILETKTEIATINKTNRGVVTTFNSSFVPRDISIQGTFGRKLRLIIGAKEPSNGDKTWFGNLMSSGNLGFNIMGGNVLVKTGYGLTKMLKKIVDTAYTLDENGKPHTLIWTNYALNTSYVVEILQSSYSQTYQNNMLWYYNLEMKAVAPASAIKSENFGGFMKKISANSIGNAIKNLLGDVTRSALQF